MTNHVYTPSSEEVKSRVARFDALQQMTTFKEWEQIGQEALDVMFARKLMPVILDDDKNLFGTTSPIIGAAGTTMFISTMPPGQGPCLHSHNKTFETFIVLEGSIEYYIGDPIEHQVTLNKWDTFSCPPGVYRAFKNVGESDAVQLTVISGLITGENDNSVAASVEQDLKNRFGDEVVDTIRSKVTFDPPQNTTE